MAALNQVRKSARLKILEISSQCDFLIRNKDIFQNT